MIIKGIETDYLVIPLNELYNEIDVLKTEIIVHGYDYSNIIRVRADAKIEQLEQIIEYYK